MKNILKNAALILTVFILAAAVPSFAAEGTQMFSESAYADGMKYLKGLTFGITRLTVCRNRIMWTERRFRCL